MGFSHSSFLPQTDCDGRSNCVHWLEGVGMKLTSFSRLSCRNLLQQCCGWLDRMLLDVSSTEKSTRLNCQLTHLHQHELRSSNTMHRIRPWTSDLLMRRQLWRLPQLHQSRPALLSHDHQCRSQPVHILLQCCRWHVDCSIPQFCSARINLLPGSKPSRANAQAHQQQSLPSFFRPDRLVQPSR